MCLRDAWEKSRSLLDEVDNDNDDDDDDDDGADEDKVSYMIDQDWMVTYVRRKRMSSHPDLGPPSPSRSWRAFALLNSHLQSIRREGRPLVIT